MIIIIFFLEKMVLWGGPDSLLHSYSLFLCFLAVIVRITSDAVSMPLYLCEFQHS